MRKKYVCITEVYEAEILCDWIVGRKSRRRSPGPKKEQMQNAKMLDQIKPEIPDVGASIVCGASSGILAKAKPRRSFCMQTIATHGERHVPRFADFVAEFPAAEMKISVQIADTH